MLYKKLDSDEILQRLQALNANAQLTWELVDGQLGSTARLADFASAFAFMTVVALAVERLNHHPEWTNTVAQVTFRLSTHAVKGLSELDFKLAEEIESAFRRFVPAG